MTTKLLQFTIIINIVLLAGQFILTSTRATDGATMSKLNNQLTEITQQNNDLRRQIFDHSSLSYIYTQAQKIQLIPVKVTFLSPLPVASAVSLPAVSLSRP